MRLITGLIGWLGRHLLLFGLLVAALLAHQLLRPSFQTHDELRASVTALRDGATALPRIVTIAIDASNARTADAAQLSRATLDHRITAATLARDERVGACGGDLAALLRGGAGQVLANRQRCIEGALFDREITLLTAMRDTLDARRPGESLEAALRRHAAVMRAGAEKSRQVRATIRQLQTQPLGSFRHATRIGQLKAEADAALTAANRAAGQGRLLLAGRRVVVTANLGSRQALADAQAQYARLVEDKAAQLGDDPVERARGWAERVGLSAVMATAGLLLAAIILTPYIIRLLFYFVLAPIAARRPSIRLELPGGCAAIPIPARSTTSVGVRLGEGEELLVRQDYLQTSAHVGAAATQWLLDWRHPLSSIATGLTFLTRLRGAGELTTVSAVRDPLAEVAMLVLPAGAACVLHPRALVAVAQPIGWPLTITSHWRLGSLHAWLTLQLRYLVFHGPARLVIKGGRGIRVERAERGRVFGQDQLVGFSADVAYSVTRAETFWPYFLGRESLLKDHVTGGEGVLIIEEAPFAGRRGDGVRGGLEGAFDAALKVVGL